MDPLERNRLLDGVLYGLVISAVLWGLIIAAWFLLA